MGWFLSRKAGRRKVRLRKSARPVRAWDPRRTLAGLQVLGAAGLLLALAVSWQWAERTLVDYAQARQPRHLDAQGVELAGATHWMSPRLQAELRTSVALQAGGNPLDHQALERAARALALSPWVRRVQRVQRLPDGSLRVAADYREPIALIEGGEGYRLLDSAGVILPGTYAHEKYSREAIQKLGLPLIVGTEAGLVREGQIWPGKDVQAGLALVKLLQGEPYLPQIEAFDVGLRDREGRVRLVLRTSGGMVRWGYPPGEERRLEQDAATKKQWLATVYRNRGAIDAGGKVVDVYGADIFIRPRDPQEPDVTLGYTWSR